MVPLRAHHLLCFLGFAGRGYDVDFTLNLAAVRAELWQVKPPVQLLAGPDAVCRGCPRLDVVGCRSEQAVAAKDATVLGWLGASVGRTEPLAIW